MKKPLLLQLFLLLSCFSFLAQAQGPGHALKFDGHDDHVVCGTSNRGVTHTVSVEAWVKTTSFKYHWIVGKYDRYGGEKGYHLIIKDGKAAFAGRDGSGQYRNSGYSPELVNDGKWHHLTGICNNGTWQIYVDGILRNELVTGYTSTNLTNTAPLALGKDFLADSENFNGQMDEVRIWKKALTVQEIRQNMCVKLGSSPGPDLIAYYNFDTPGSATVKDLSSQKLDGTFRNMSPSTAWLVSGAPIGDKSSFHYATNWQGQSVQLTVDGSTLSAYDLSNTMKGFHIYHIASAPNSTTGIVRANQVTDYYGVFKVGLVPSSYTVQYVPEASSCSYSLFRRADNAAPTWNKISEVPHTEPLIYTGTAEQGEFSFNSATLQAAKIQSSGNFCTGSTSTLSITTNGSVLWSTGETSKSIRVSQAGEYSVTVTDGGCTYTDKISVAEVPFPEVTLGADRILCAEEVAKLEAPAGAYTYKWSTGATTSSIEASKSGTYWVEVTNSNGCTSKDEVQVTVRPQPDIPLQQEIIACYGERVTLNATTPGASYRWSNGLTSPGIEVTSPAQLSVVVTVNGCSYTRQVTVSSTECPVIPNIITPNGDGKNDAFVLQGINVDAVSIEIFNRWGTRVYQKDLYDNQWNAAGSGGGMYYYHIKSRDTQKVYKGWLEVVL